MAVTWNDIAASPNFKDMMDGDREKVRTDFFQKNVVPMLDDSNKEYATNKFYDMTKDDVLPPQGLTAEDAIPEILGSKGVGAFLVGMGSSMRDTYDGAKQIFDIGEQELENDKKLFNELEQSEYSGTVFAGQITGFLAEPIGVLAPIAKGKSLFQIAKIGAATGAGFGAVGYVDTNKDQTRMGNILLGAVVGGTLSPAFTHVARGFKGAAEVEMRSASLMLKNFDNEMTKFQSAGASASLASRAAKRKLSYTDDDITSALMKTEREKASLGADSVEDASRMMEGKLQSNFNPEKTAAEIRASRMIYRLPLVGEKLQETAASLTKGRKGSGRMFENYMTPIVSRLSEMNEKLGFSMRKLEAKTHIEIANTFEKVNPFSDGVKKLPTRVRDSLKKPLLSGDFKEVKRILGDQKNGKKLLAQFNDVNKELGKLYANLRKVGYKIPKLDNYWPRIVKDADGITKIEHSTIKRAYDAAAKKKGGKLTEKEKANVVKHMFTPGQQEKAWGMTSASLKKRKFNKMDEELMPYYADPMDGLNHYIHQNINDINRRKFMKNHGYKKTPKVDGSDMEDSVQEIIVAMRDRGEINIKQEGEIIEMLTARFGKGEQAPSKTVQFFKNSTYALTLGNPISALTQFGDLAFSAYKYGAYNAITSLFGKKLAKKEDLGLMDAIEEFASDKSKAKTLADWSFRWGGFNKIDRLGKETYVTAAMKSWGKMARGNDKGKDAFRKKWGAVFGDETEQLMKDVGDKKLTDNVKLLLWNELSDVQPISLSEMPLKYLQSPNGRILYTLKTFTIKQLDFMRKEIINEYKAGRKVQAMRNTVKFTGLFVAANTTVDVAKDFLKGKEEINIEDHLVDNIWTLIGLNKYTYKEAANRGIGTALKDIIAPPLNVYDDVTRGFDDPKRWWNLLPPYGKLMYNWTKDDKEKYYEFTDIGKEW